MCIIETGGDTERQRQREGTHIPQRMYGGQRTTSTFHFVEASSLSLFLLLYCILQAS